MGRHVVSEYMTMHPHSIDEQATLRQAMEQMTQHQIRHLPVKRGGQVIGILSDRDLKLFFGISNINPAHLKVSSISHGHPYTVPPDAPLAEVAKKMAAQHYGSALVMKGDELLGIFTTVDACRALSELA